jgi:pSer/pThr/pTyr-binding forkhead associated (FHA) protein
MIDAKLVMFRSGGERRDFPLGAERTLIGRKNDCDIRIPLTEVSRHHTEFRVENDSIMVKDLGSANGTFVNNKRVTSCKLAPGDHVIIGPVVFTLQVGGKPADIRPVKTRLTRQTPGGLGREEIDITAGLAASAGASAISDDELDPISALEALASSADQTAIDPFEEEEL